MPTTESTFWSRLTGSLRRRPDSAERQPYLSHDDSDAGAPGVEPAPAQVNVADRARAIARRNKRDEAFIQLQKGYEKVTQVVEEIQHHLVQQGERSERLCAAIEQIARSMADGPQLARQQSQTLEQIATQLEAANTRTRQLAEAMSELPRVAHTQSETLTSISRQLEVSNEQRIVASQTMDRLGTSLETLGQTSRQHGEVLQRMNLQSAEQSQRLAQLIAQQSHRFQMLFVVTVVMALLAIGTAVAGLAMFRP